MDKNDGKIRDKLRAWIDIYAKDGDKPDVREKAIKYINFYSHELGVGLRQPVEYRDRSRC